MKKIQAAVLVLVCVSCSKENPSSSLAGSWKLISAADSFAHTVVSKPSGAPDDILVFSIAPFNKGSFSGTLSTGTAISGQFLLYPKEFYLTQMALRFPDVPSGSLDWEKQLSAFASTTYYSFDSQGHLVISFEYKTLTFSRL